METRSDVKIEMTTEIANGRKNSPIIPLTKARGRNTTTVANVEEPTAPMTSLAAR